MNCVTTYRLGTVEYGESMRLQENLVKARARGSVGDMLLLLQHPPVITVGRGGGPEDILAPAEALRDAGIQVHETDRGGRATYHGPGQLVAYPILRPGNGDLLAHVWRLEETAIRVLNAYGLKAGRVEGQPGVWMGAANGNGGGHKIAAVGLAVRDGITLHGLALNVAPEMGHFDLLIPCGDSDARATSMAQELGWEPDLGEAAQRFQQAFGEVFSCQVNLGEPAELVTASGERPEQPPWLWQRIAPEAEEAVARVQTLLERFRLNTVCQEARCPNIAECFGQDTATFMILGDTCSRGCRFCAVNRGRPKAPDPDEPERVASASAALGLRHVVITSVTRDDLQDGGAGHFAATIQAVSRRSPETTVEVLIPDFRGSLRALETVLASEPEVLNHNLETVSRLYARVRPGADYRRSLGVLAWAKRQAHGVVTKSGLMLGLGERTTEVLQTLGDLRQAGCDLLTLGQYLQPTDRQLAVERYVPPVEFEGYRVQAESLGFRGVAAGPMVRSSHRAEALWRQVASG